jgi:hypothetical protein
MPVGDQVCMNPFGLRRRCHQVQLLDGLISKKYALRSCAKALGQARKLNLVSASAMVESPLSAVVRALGELSPCPSARRITDSVAGISSISSRLPRPSVQSPADHSTAPLARSATIARSEFGIAKQASPPRNGLGPFGLDLTVAPLATITIRR